MFINLYLIFYIKMIVKNITIGIGFCFMCGKLFTKGISNQSDPLSKTMNHGIPKSLKPKFNVLFPLHLECHKKINELYISTQKRPVEMKKLNYLKSRVESLSGMSDRFDNKVKGILKQINEDLGKIKL